MNNEERIKLGNRMTFLKTLCLKKRQEHRIDELKFLVYSKEILDGNYLELMGHIKRYEDQTL
jgi:hypothetical protein